MYTYLGACVHVGIIVGFSYVRAEVLAGFVNGLFLVFISFFIFSEAVEVVRLFSLLLNATICGT